MSGRSIKRAIDSPSFSLPLQSGQMGRSGSITQADHQSVPLGLRQPIPISLVPTRPYRTNFSSNAAMVRHFSAISSICS